MHRNNGNHRDNRISHGLTFMMWPALVRAPWLIGSFLETDERREADRRRKFVR
jgi:hypothetical protein